MSSVEVQQCPSAGVVLISADGGSRASRAARIRAAAKRLDVGPLDSRSYSETYGFQTRSTFSYWSSNG